LNLKQLRSSHREDPNGQDQVSPAPRPRCRAPHRCRGEDQGRHHHSGLRRDEAGKLIPIDLKTGDKVLFGKWSGTEVKIDGEELLIMKESDIMGVIA
jgi:hypothetical protein